MNRSKGRAIVLVVIATALALAIGLSLLPRLSTGPAEAPASVASAPEGAASPGEPEALVQTVNGITVSAANFRRVGNRVQADVCLVRPDDGDWLIHRPGLRYAVGGAEAEISDFSGIPIEVKSPPVNGQFGYRCDTLSFDVPAEAEASSERDLGTVLLPEELCARLVVAAELHSTTALRAALVDLRQLGPDAGQLADRIRHLMRGYDMDGIRHLLLRTVSPQARAACASPAAGVPSLEPHGP